MRTVLHLSEDSLGFLELRRAQYRNHAFKRPVIESSLILKLQSANGMRDFFKRIFNRMRKRIHRIDAPFVSRCMVFGKTNAVDRRVTEIHVGTGHVDARPQHH